MRGRALISEAAAFPLMRWAVLSSCLLVLSAGCLTDSGDILEDTVVGGILPTGDLPFGCDATRPTVVHALDKVEIESYSGALGVPCLVLSPWGGYEPSVGVGADGELYLYPAWPVDTTSDGLAARAFGMGLAKTADGGETWERKLSEVAGTANWQFFTADPFMYVDPATGRIWMEDLIIPPFNCSNLSFSDDGGETWTQTLGGCLEWDHVTYGAGPFITTEPGDYPNALYRCAIALGATTIASEASGCQKSVDGGMNWGVTTYPYFGDKDGQPYVPGDCNGGMSHIKVDHRGWVWAPRGWCNDPYISVSKDEGATWEQHQVYDKPVDSGHETSVAVDANGLAYYFWFGEGDQPLLAISRDDGVTWSKPVSIAPPGFIQGAMPSLVAGGGGKIGVSYVANFEQDNGEGVHGVVAVGYGVDTDSPTFLSQIVNPLDQPLGSGECSGQGCANQGDFLTLALGPDGLPWSAFMGGTYLVGGRLYGVPSLWDAADPNGPYPN